MSTTELCQTCGGYGWGNSVDTGEPILCPDCQGEKRVVAEPMCDYCGFLGWTVTNFGVLTHKHSCPHNIAHFCQTEPKECPNANEHPGRAKLIGSDA